MHRLVIITDVNIHAWNINGFLEWNKVLTCCKTEISHIIGSSNKGHRKVQAKNITFKYRFLNTGNWLLDTDTECLIKTRKT